VNLGVEFDQEPFPLEAQLANLGPVEGIDLGVSLQKNTLLLEKYYDIKKHITYHRNYYDIKQEE